MKKVSKVLLSIGLSIMMCFGIVAVGQSTASEVVLTDAAEGSYYSGLTAKSGNALLGQLHDLITTTHTTYTSYDSIKTYGYTTDPGLDGKGVLEFYTHETVMTFSGTLGTWNREHVWCQSNSNGLWGKTGGGADLHHIRPTESGLNSTRGNNKYGEVTNGKEAWSRKVGGANSELGGWVSGSTFEPLDNVKGDVARIVMYVYTHYNTYKNVYGSTNGHGGNFGTLNFTHIMSASSESAAKALLLKWNEEDPVDAIETLRNEEVFKIQGNRNPFIDHPEYADYIWGSGTSGGGSTTPSNELQSISVSPAYLTLNVGDNSTLTVTPTPSSADASVSWTSSDQSVASVSSSGVVTAKAAGTATITATSTKDTSIKATSTVTVKQAGSTTPSTPPTPPSQTSGKATIDISSFGSLSGQYGFYSWSAGGIGGMAFIYPGNKKSLQLNSSQKCRYIASNVALAGSIKSVTIKLSSDEGQDGAQRTWRLLTSNSAYSELSSGNPQNGNDHDTKTLTKGGEATWTVTGNDTYFALCYESSGACYVESITITYEGSTSGGEDVGGGDVGGGDIGGDEIDDTKLNAFHDAVANILTTGTLEERRASINEAIAAYQALSQGEKAIAAADVELLQEAIDHYNQTVRAYNEDALAANKALG